jgi:hypothetical protein
VRPRLPAVSEKKAPEERHVYRINAPFPNPFRCSRIKAGVTDITGSQQEKAPEERNVYRIEASFPAPFRCSGEIEKEGIESAISEFETGKGIPHSQVMKNFRNMSFIEQLSVS